MNSIPNRIIDHTLRSVDVGKLIFAANLDFEPFDPPITAELKH